MPLTPEQLREFENGTSPVGIADWFPAMPERIAEQLRQAVKDGLLKSMFGPTATSGKHIWTEYLILTDAGRIAAGLKPLEPPKPVVVKATQREMF